MEYAEAHDWDELTMDSVVHSGIEALAKTIDLFSRLSGTTTEKPSAKQHEKPQVSKPAVTDKPAESRLKSVATTLKTASGEE
jgi:hypothetical protein